jgi:peptide/nickel transport system ATP-binding protein
MAEEKDTLLEVKDLKKYFPIQSGFWRRTVGFVKAVDGVNFQIKRGETLGLVGESGCGKTTTGRCILRVIEPTTGQILLKSNGHTTSVTELSRREIKRYRRHMQMIFQDPYSSLNPRMTVLEIVGEPLLVNGIARGKELQDRVEKTLVSVGLKTEHMRRYPHSFSGGQRQRIGIARALVLRPQLIVADEPVSALDVSIQSQIVNLLQDLQDEYHLTYLFIAHDMSVVRQISNRIAVMYVGKLVEMANTDELLSNPRHPYTEALLSAVPRPDPHHVSGRMILRGEAPDPANPPPGCVFQNRCKYAQDICRVEAPPLVEVAPGHLASCHFADSLELRGLSPTKAPAAAPVTTAA